MRNLDAEQSKGGNLCECEGSLREKSKDEWRKAVTSERRRERDAPPPAYVMTRDYASEVARPREPRVEVNKAGGERMVVGDINRSGRGGRRTRGAGNNGPGSASAYGGASAYIDPANDWSAEVLRPVAEYAAERGQLPPPPVHIKAAAIAPEDEKLRADLAAMKAAPEEMAEAGGAQPAE